MAEKLRSWSGCRNPEQTGGKNGIKREGLQSHNTRELLRSQPEVNCRERGRPVNPGTRKNGGNEEVDRGQFEGGVKGG